MNRKIALSLILASTGAVALADDITMDPPFTSTANRAQVVHELHQYRQAGINPWADDYNPAAQFRSERTRQEVTREFLAERDAVAARNGEDSGSASMARRESQDKGAFRLAGGARDE